MSRTSAFRLYFLSLTVAQVIAIFGDRLHQFSVVGMIGRLEPGSSSELFQLSLFMQLPGLLFGPVLGTFLDRSNKAVVLVTVDAARGLVVLAIPAFYHALHSLYAFYVPVFLLSLANMLFAPAKSAVIPEIFGRDGLLPINAALWATGIVGTLAGFLLAGYFFDFRSWEWSFYVNGASYLFSVLFLLPLLFAPRRDVETPGERASAVAEWAPGIVSSIREGVALIRRIPSVALSLWTQTSLVGCLGLAFVLAVARIQSVLPAGRTLYLSAVASCAMAGLLAGSAFGALARGRFALPRLVAYASIAFGAAWIGLAHSTHVAAVAAWAFVMGAAASPVWITAETLLQTHAPLAFRGRVFAAREMLTRSAFLVLASAGALADAAFDRELVMTAVGVLLAGIGVVFHRKSYSQSGIVPRNG